MKTASVRAAPEAAALKVSAQAYRYRFWLACCFLAVLVYSHFSDSSSVGIFVLFLLNIIFCADVLFRNAWQDILRIRITVSVVTAASIGAVLGYEIAKTFLTHPLAGPVEHIYIASSIGVMGYLWNASRYARRKEQTSIFINKLKDFLPKSARLLQEGREQMIFADELQENDIIKVKPGERIACEGIVIHGSSYIDESLITGNMLPARKTAKERVYAGTLNKSDEICVQVHQPLAHSVLAGIIDNIKQSEMRRCLRENRLDKYAWVLLAVMGLAAAGAYTYFYGQSGYTRPLHYVGIILFVIGLGCPLSFFGCALWPGYFIRKGAKRLLIEIQSLESLKVLQQASTVFIDKTGTLTYGTLQVDTVYVCAGQSEAELWSCLVTAEQATSGPFAHAVAAYAQAHQLTPLPLTNAQVCAGRGVRVVCQGDILYAGRGEWLEEQGITLTQRPAATQPVIYVAKNKTYLGYVLLEDKVRIGAAELVSFLKEQQKEVILMSGDNEGSVQAVAQQVGISSVNAGVLPQTKAEIIGNYAALGKQCVMIGDGFNDVSALLYANAGVVFSASQNVYNNWVDVVVANQDLRNVRCLFGLEKVLNSNVHTNVIISILWNLLVLTGVLFAPLSAAQAGYVLAGGITAGVIMVFFNSTRLLHIK